MSEPIDCLAATNYVSFAVVVVVVVFDERKKDVNIT